jgi:predicted MFS family arabinose efflux permease
MTAPETRVDGRLVALLSVACGAAVANLYYGQPLLAAIADDLHVGSATAALLVTASQIGYAAGLLGVLPLGDLLERRRLVCRLLLVTAVALVVAAVAPSFAVLAIGVGAAGVTSVVAQVLVPYASTLAAEAERGRVVGRVMSGLLIGILLTRTIAGLVASAGGWRFVYGLAAVLMLALAALLWRFMPVIAPHSDLPYPRLLRSVGTLVREEPVLRVRMAFGALGFGSFSVLWTAIAFLLSQPPYDYGEAAIGLFGLAGLAGAATASFSGRLADAGHSRIATGAFLACVLASWGLLALGAHSLVALVAGIVLLDLGVQGAHLQNQHAVYGLHDQARSRLNTAYMTCNFAGGALASAAAALAWDRGGWGAVAALGAALPALALVLWLAKSAATTSSPARSADIASEPSRSS